MGKLVPPARIAVVAVLTALAVLAPLLLFGSLVLRTIDRDVVARSADERSAAARIAAASIDRELRAAGSDLELFSSAAALVTALRQQDRAALDRRLGSLLRDRPNALGAILDPSGIVLSAPLARELVGQDFSRRDYFQGALAQAAPYISEIFASASAGNPSVVGVSLAIRDGDAPLGVVVMTLQPRDILDLLAPLRQVEGRELLILDRADRVVASTDAGLRPLSVLHVSSVAPSGKTVEVMGRQRIITTGAVGLSHWTLYVVDDPEVVLAGERSLIAELRSGSAVIGLLGLVLAAGIVLLYARTVRQRDALQSGRAALEASRAELATTNRALEEASRHKSDFLAGMSHELRTPLNAILGFSALLEEQVGEALAERQRRYLRNIAEAGTHLLGLINDVLDLSKVEAGRVELRREAISLEALLEPTVSASRAAAQAAGVRFDIIVPLDVHLDADAGRVRQILYNLLSNAVKFTPAGGRVDLAVSVDGSALDVAVSDTGIGIPADKRERVFGMFERLHEGRSDAAGTGLGLALTKRLVELHAGTIGFADREGGGTVFRVRLPDLVVVPHADERVLVVEDERRDADLIVALAARSGLDAEVTTSVAAATAAIQRATPSGVVLDLRLEQDRGERVLEALKADPVTRGVPVIVVTVEDDDGRARALGADDHITKPIRHERLSRWLETVAARRTQRGSTGEGAAR